jgi:hypothetical protein
VCSARPRGRRLARPVRRQPVQPAAQLAAALHVGGLVDGFVAHPHHPIAWELASATGPRPAAATTMRPASCGPGRPAGDGPASGSWAAWPAAGRAGAPATPGTGPGRRLRRPPATPWRSPSPTGRRSRRTTVRRARPGDLLPVWGASTAPVLAPGGPGGPAAAGAAARPAPPPDASKPTWAPISRSDRPRAFSRSASCRCSAVRCAAIGNPLGRISESSPTRRGSCVDHLNAPTVSPVHS